MNLLSLNRLVSKTAQNNLQNKPKTKTKNQKPKTKNQKPKTKNQKPKTKNQKPKTKNQKPKTKPNNKPKTKNQKPKTKNQKKKSKIKLGGFDGIRNSFFNLLCAGCYLFSLLFYPPFQLASIFAYQ